MSIYAYVLTSDSFQLRHLSAPLWSAERGAGVVPALRGHEPEVGGESREPRLYSAPAAAVSIPPCYLHKRARLTVCVCVSIRFDEAIESYHAVLALDPSHSVCTEMLNHATEDSLRYAFSAGSGLFAALRPEAAEEGQRPWGAASPSGGISASGGAAFAELSPLIAPSALTGVLEDSPAEAPLSAVAAAAAPTGRAAALAPSTARGPAGGGALFGNDSSMSFTNSLAAQSGIRARGGGGAAQSTAGPDGGSMFSAPGYAAVRGGDELGSPFTNAGSVCPFPGFGSASGALPSRRLDAASPTGNSAVGMGVALFSADSAGDGAAGADYSPYSNLLALGGARRISLNRTSQREGPDRTAQAGDAAVSSKDQFANREAASRMVPSFDPSHANAAMDTDDSPFALGGGYSLHGALDFNRSDSGGGLGHDESSAADLSMSGAGSFMQNSSASVISYSRVTGNLAMSPIESDGGDS
jgi:hypothetical protein